MPAPYRHRRAGPGHRDRGSAAVEMVLLTPVLMLFLFLIVAAGRLIQARLEVDSAAQQAARAASLARDPASAAADATANAQSALASQHLTCDPVSVTPDLADFTPGGQVTVQVSCTVSLAGLGLLHLGGAETLTSTFTAPIDRYRGVSLGFRNSEGSSAANPSTGGAL